MTPIEQAIEALVRKAFEDGLSLGVDSGGYLPQEWEAWRSGNLEALAALSQPQAPLEHRREIRFVDATPDESFPIHILQAYKETGMFTDNALGLDPESPICRQMNEWQEQRNSLLDKAIKRLTEATQKQVLDLSGLATHFDRELIYLAKLESAIRAQLHGVEIKGV